MSNVVIVESPAKAKTINKYLGSDYQVIASYGHIRDLPSKDGSVKPDDNFTIIYEINDKSKKHIKSIADAVKKSKKIYLATDPDREGEAISWHIIEALTEVKALKKDAIVKRIVFNEITKKAVNEAIQNPRDIDMDLVNAQQARRALDYLVGFTLSPVLWRKLPGSKSAGRVQSVALRIICEREDEIERFITQEYWDIKLDFLTGKKDKITATVTHINNKKLDKFDLSNEAAVKAVVEQLDSKDYNIINIEKKQVNRNPMPPFTTSSLQQEASRKLGFSANYTMQLAQKLYEGVEVNGETVGLITYMRTDGVQLSEESVKATRELIVKNYGEKYLPKSPRMYKTKTKNAQEAHEAIRPTNVKFTPDQAQSSLNKDMHRLYELIWKRLVACQMENALLDTVAVIIETKDKYATLKANGSILAFDGFLKLYQETKDDEEDEEQKLLPEVKIGDPLSLNKINPAQHFTEPPPRYSEASLIKKLEEIGIGRPSTFVPIILIIQERNYVKLEKKRFFPEERGRLVVAFLINFFKKYVEYDFTADLEEELDNISAGKMEWKKLLEKFWQDFNSTIQDVKKRDMTEILTALNEALEFHLFHPSKGEKANRDCPACTSGKLSLKLGKFGAFIACSSYPECHYTRPIGDSAEEQEGEAVIEQIEHKTLGVDDTTGLEVTLRKGPYGFYVQLGETGKGKNKPKRMSLPAGVEPTDITFIKALSLLSLPREIGLHPGTQKMISAGIGRFGPYLLHDGKYTSVDKSEDILQLGINRAVAIIEDNKKGTAKGNQPLSVIGMHPLDNKEIAIYDGRYGPYIKHNKVNVPIPKKTNINDVTLTMSLELIEAQIEKNASTKRAPSGRKKASD